MSGALQAVYRNLRSFGTEFTVVFNVNTSYTMPTGVTLLTSAVGKGANGAADSWTGSDMGMVRVQTYANAVYGVISKNYSDIRAEANTLVSNINVGAPGERIITNAYLWEYKLGSNALLGFFDYGNEYSTDTIRGTATLYAESPASGPIVQTNQVQYNVGRGIEVKVPGAAGASSTGFGKTFPGGAGGGGAAPTTTFTNVTVISGNVYSVVVPTGGQITIKYIK